MGRIMLYRLLSVLLVFLLFPEAYIIVSAGHEYYTYYGYVPSRIWYAKPKSGTHGIILKGIYNITYVQWNATLTIVGWHDDTEVEVLTLPDNCPVFSTTINGMEKVHVLLPNGTFFKLRASRPVFALLTAGRLNRTEPQWPPTIIGFIPSVDGAAVGKEFIFIAIQRLVETPYRFRALENSKVKILDSTGSVVRSFDLAANTFKDVGLKPNRVYRVVSTGNIEIQSFSVVRTRYIPSVTGSYIGTAFYSSSSMQWNPQVSHGFMLIALDEDARVEIYDVEYKRKIYETTVPAGKFVLAQPKTVRMNTPPLPEIFIRSDKPIMVCYIHHGTRPGATAFLGGGEYGTGVTYLTIKPNEPTMVYVPVNCTSKSFIFAYRDTNVILDGLQLRLEADHYLPLPQGLHEVSSDAELLVQITHWPSIPSFQGIYDFSSIIPSAQLAGIKKDVKISPPTGAGGPPYTLYGGVAIAALAVILAYLLRSRRGRT